MSAQQTILFLCFAMSCVGALIFIVAESPQRTLPEAARTLLRSQAVRFSDPSNISGRLQSLRKGLTFAEFKTEQMLNTGTTFVVTFTLFMIMTGSVGLSISISLAGAAIIYVLIDKNLSQEIEKNRRQLEAEFPAIVEMMSLALSAGQTPAQAMFRISERSTGLLARQFSQTVEEIRNGVPFHLALDGMGRRINSLVIRRFIDALVIAVVRGAPLVDVLQRHALESRQSHKNEVLAKAGKAEISMMIPIVFLILPISILFALWPSLSTLNLFST